MLGQNIYFTKAMHYPIWKNGAKIPLHGIGRALGEHPSTTLRASAQPQILLFSLKLWPFFWCRHCQTTKRQLTQSLSGQLTVTEEVDQNVFFCDAQTISAAAKLGRPHIHDH